jgi:hypothetical protein
MAAAMNNAPQIASPRQNSNIAQTSGKITKIARTQTGRSQVGTGGLSDIAALRRRHQGFDRGDGRIGLGAVRAAGLGKIGPAAAALAAQSR